jgi:hypothetical protein
MGIETLYAIELSFGGPVADKRLHYSRPLEPPLDCGLCAASSSRATGVRTSELAHIDDLLALEYGP